MDYTSFNIQEIFGWEGYHLHNFKSKDSNDKDIEYGIEEDGETRPIDKPLNKLEPEPEENDTVTESGTAKSILSRHSDILPRFFFAIPDERIRDERIYKLYDVFNEKNRFLDYEYDFGACWEHVIEFEGVSDDISQNGEYPMSIDGRGANRMEDNQDEDSDGDLRPSFKKKKFNRQQAQRHLRKVFDGKWPLKVNNRTVPKCYMCAWFDTKRGGRRRRSCDGKCCGVCLKSEFIRESAAGE